MIKFNLMAHNATKGKQIVYLYRRASQEATEAGWNVAYTTENEKSISVDSDATQTKDGVLRTASSPELEITGTSLLKVNDPRADELEDACINNELMQIWEADLARPCTTDTYALTTDTAIVAGKTYYTRSGSGTTESPYVYTPVATPSASSLTSYYEKESTPNGKFKGRYYEGYLTEFTKSSNAEDYSEIQLTFGINGKGTTVNEVTVPSNIVDESSYVFKDTTVIGA